MDKSDFVRLFAYDRWANQECLKALAAGAPETTTVGRLAHILSAENLWLERIQKVPQSMAVWPSLSLEECDALVDDVARPGVTIWRRWLPMDCRRPSNTRTAKVRLGQSRVEDVLMHVIMHSAYHRGQIAMEMRASGWNRRIQTSFRRRGKDFWSDGIPPRFFL